jgi:hypothetical protein
MHLASALNIMVGKLNTLEGEIHGLLYFKALC